MGRRERLNGCKASPFTCEANGAICNVFVEVHHKLTFPICRVCLGTWLKQGMPK